MTTYRDILAAASDQNLTLPDDALTLVRLDAASPALAWLAAAHEADAAKAGDIIDYLPSNLPA